MWHHLYILTEQIATWAVCPYRVPLVDFANWIWHALSYRSAWPSTCFVTSSSQHFLGTMVDSRPTLCLLSPCPLSGVAHFHDGTDSSLFHAQWMKFVPTRMCRLCNSTSSTHPIQWTMTRYATRVPCDWVSTTRSGVIRIPASPSDVLHICFHEQG